MKGENKRESSITQIPSLFAACAPAAATAAAWAVTERRQSVSLGGWSGSVLLLVSGRRTTLNLVVAARENIVRGKFLNRADTSSLARRTLPTSHARRKFAAFGRKRCLGGQTRRQLLDSPVFDLTRDVRTSNKGQQRLRVG